LGRRIEIDGCNDLAIDLDLSLAAVRTQRRDPRQARRRRGVRWLGDRARSRGLLDGPAKRTRKVHAAPATVEAGVEGVVRIGHGERTAHREWREVALLVDRLDLELIVRGRG